MTDAKERIIKTMGPYPCYCIFFLIKDIRHYRLGQYIYNAFKQNINASMKLIACSHLRHNISDT